MDYSQIIDRLFRPVHPEEVASRLSLVQAKSKDNQTTEVCKQCFSCLDLTTLCPTDSAESVAAFARKSAEFNRHFPHIANVATLCVYPVFVDVAGIALGESEIGIASVGAGFPSSQTFPEVKALECAMAEESGADEIDIVLNLGLYFDGNHQAVANEIEMICRELGTDTVLKVILETGLLPTLDDVRKAAVLAMAGGADMIKTSTGKQGPGATPEAFYVMCEAVRDYFNDSGKRVGVKVAGGVRTAEEAILYYTIAKEVLGEEWLTPEHFRIGASALANDLLSKIEGKEVRYF